MNAKIFIINWKACTIQMSVEFGMMAIHKAEKIDHIRKPEWYYTLEKAPKMGTTGGP